MNIRKQVHQKLRRISGGLETDILKGLWIGGNRIDGNGHPLYSYSPVDGAQLGKVNSIDSAQATLAISAAGEAFNTWRSVPAPQRGEFVRQFGNLLREHKEDLAFIVSAECGKIYQEALGEVQEMIDICDFAVGLSRQLYGLSIASERPSHRLTEQWHPLGPVGCISAFNFPVAVWAWNAAIAWVCGDPVIWKPSEKTPLTSIACQAIVSQLINQLDYVPDGVSNLAIGEAVIGEALAESEFLPLISATGSIPMGQQVAQKVAKRLGRSLLELGGNNAAIVTESADINLAIRAIVFAAVGTCGQRCTTLRRLIVHNSIREPFVDLLKKTYSGLPIGNPIDESTLIGPLIDKDAFDQMQAALSLAESQGGRVYGGTPAVVADELAQGHYVHPAIVEISPDAEVLQNEVFAPILYVMGYENFDDAIILQNDVPQGLSSAVFTSDVKEAEKFCSPTGSDCGIANVNIGTSGAEIGGAFGGEKQTGGGRESGSDAWKSYMRRATNTINFSDELPLAQRIKFG